MFSLVTERGRFVRVRKSVKKEDVIKTFMYPAGEVFCGQIIEIGPPKRYCYALAGDTYKKIARRERVNEEALIKLNGGRCVYPTMRVWLP